MPAKRPPLLLAGQGGRDKVVEALIGVDVSTLVADARASTPLHMAAAAGHVRVCRTLMAAGADEHVPNAQLFLWPSALRRIELTPRAYYIAML